MLPLVTPPLSKTSNDSFSPFNKWNQKSKLSSCCFLYNSTVFLSISNDIILLFKTTPWNANQFILFFVLIILFIFSIVVYGLIISIPLVESRKKSELVEAEDKAVSSLFCNKKL